MSIAIPYNQRLIEIQVPPERLLGVLGPRETAVRPNQEQLLKEATCRPLAAPPLAEFAQPGEPVLVVVNDATRPTPTAALLASIWPSICAWDSSFLVATGAHRAPSEAEYRQLFGGLWETVRRRVSAHDCRDAAALGFAGRTAAGTEVWLNRLALETGKILLIGSVEPHYFAGYTGGRKAILPGIAGYSSIEQNHSLAMSPRAQALQLAGNPVHEDMDQALELLPRQELFALSAVLDRERRLVAAWGGEPRQTLLQAADLVNHLFTVPIEQKADIVMAVASHPLDIDFYQAQKTIENGKLALKRGGILILVSACREGIGNAAFLQLMSQATAPRQCLELAQGRYRLGHHKAARLAELATWAETWAVTGIDESALKTAFMRPFPDLQSACDAALAARPEGKMWVLLEASHAVPRLVEQE